MHYCYLMSNDLSEVVKVICQWADTETLPENWNRTGTARDGRGIYTKDGYRQSKRRGYPNCVKLTPVDRGDFPQWRVLNKDGGEHEKEIEYFYPSDTGAPLGKVVRRQWSDRRRVYEQNRKTKAIRPWHWTTDGWVPGKGDRPWGLYREQEAREEILRGGFVFAVGGEQAVETYRELGLVATTCAGGEANYRTIVDRLKDTFACAVKEGLTPLLVIHPDNDVTGENKFGEELVEHCSWSKIPAVVMEPLALWAEMPQGGDIYDWVHRPGADWDDKVYLLRALETEIDEAIERQEIADKSRQQRDRWKAPVSWQGELGYWVTDTEGDNKSFKPKTDFDFQVERELAGNDGGGLLLQVKIAHQKGQRRIFVKNKDCTTVQTFENAVKDALGMTIICNLSTSELKALLRVRLHEYHVNRKGKTYRLIDRVGQQEDGVWVFKDRQLTPDGQVTSETDTRWVWNELLTGDRESLPKPLLAEPNEGAIAHLLGTMKQAFGCNFHAALLVLGYAVAGLYYQQIIKEDGAFPILNPYGDPGSGKSSAAECALSLVGMHDDGMLKDVSLSAAYEKLKVTGGLAYCLDDPKRDENLDEFLKGFYNGKARVVRGKEAAFNVQRPHSPLMVTSNHACGEQSAATKSRLISLWFRKAKDGDPAAWRELPRAKTLASGGLPQLLRLGYNKAEIEQIQGEIAKYLPYAHARIAKSLALVTWYAEGICRLAAMPQEIDKLRRYITTTVCPGSNDPDEAGDSLRDFIDKLFILQSQGKVGDWNMRWVEKKDETERYFAIYMPGIWQVFDKEFKPAYSKKVVEALLMEQGIHGKSRQRFHMSEDESKAYYRLLINTPCDSEGNKVDPGQPRTTIRFCYEIPEKLLREFSDKKSINEINSDDFSPETQNGKENPLLINSNNFDQQRSTGSTEPTVQGSLFPNPVDRVDPCCFKPELQINSEIEPPQSDSGEKSASVDLLIEKNDIQTLTDPLDPYSESPASMTGVPVFGVPIPDLPIPTDLERGDLVWAFDGKEWRKAAYQSPVRGMVISYLSPTNSLGNAHQVKVGSKALKVTMNELRRRDA
jgi:hypothetical protein